MAATKIWVNDRDQENFVFIPHHDHYSFYYGHAPDAISIDKHLQNINHAISSQDCARLKTLLCYKLQCSAVIDNEENHYGNEPEDQRTTHYEVEVRPIIDGLIFLENFGPLRTIVQGIAEKQNLKLYKVFAECLDASGLSEEHLFAWSKALCRAVHAGINNLKEHGEELEKSGHPKGKEVLAITQQLNQFIRVMEPSYEGVALIAPTAAEAVAVPAPVLAKLTKPLDALPTYQKNLRVLLFKLDCCAALHPEESTLNVHRHYTKLIVNLCSLLLTGGLANLLHYARTGDWLFFRETRSQSFIVDLEKNLSPAPETVLAR